MPDKGKTPTIAPIFTKAWEITIITIPTTISLPKLSLTLLAILSPLKAKKTKSPMILTAPTKPNSSLSDAKMKSVGESLDLSEKLLSNPHPSPGQLICEESILVVFWLTLRAQGLSQPRDPLL